MRLDRFVVMAVAVTCGVMACDDDPTRPSNRRVESFRATLTGAAERPTPNSSTATGSATILIISNRADANSAFEVDTISYNVTYAGLTADLSGAHIHGPATTEQSVGVILNFNPGTTARTGNFSGLAPGTGTFPVAAVQIDSVAVLIRNGMSYVNLHSLAAQGGFPGGEIRGQIVPNP